MANYAPLYLALNAAPRDIVLSMDNLIKQHARTAQFVSRRFWIPVALAVAGGVLLLFEFLFGYGRCLFGIAGIGLGITALVVFIILAVGRSEAKSYGPQFDTTREIIYTLRDDLAPGKDVFGHIDLTGPMRPEKVARKAENAMGRSITFYRDEWLNLKARLYDGNMLRVSAVHRIKQRDSFSKRSQVSRKTKWKPAVTKADVHELSVRVSANPELYHVRSGLTLQKGQKVGAYQIAQISDDGGILTLTAVAPAGNPIQAQDILGVLRATYDQLERKASK